MSANLKQVVEDLAGLVVDDEQAQPFQNKDRVAQWLFFIGQSLSGVDAMHAVGSAAEHKMA